LKRKLIEDSINFLKYVQKQKGMDIDLSSLIEYDLEVPDENTDIEELKVKIMIDNHATEYKEKIVGENIVRDALPNALIKEDWMEAASAAELDAKINKCVKCNLSTTRKNFVYGTGNPNADVMVIGEAPGADEDEQGLPFVGRAGKLLTDILKAINFSREDIYICNILKCRPPENRNPNPEEILKCEPYLIKQIELIKPKLILCVGTFAGQTMLRSKETLGKMRGKFYNIKFGSIEVKVMVTYHPAALLRNPNWKKPTWEDVQLFRSEYDKEKK
jgi:uracil-DNA glycosylase